jgi:biotin carboxyl carrier protein
MTAKGQTFICYAKEDVARVRKLYDDLRLRNVIVWFDEENLGPGEWKPQINKAIAQSSSVLFCLSNAAIKKTGNEKPGFQDYELNRAYEIAQAQSPAEFTIIPLRLEDCYRGDHRLTTYQQFDLFTDWDRVLDKLAVRLGGQSLSKRGAQDNRSDIEQLVDKLLGKAITFHYARDYRRAYSMWLAIEEIEGRTTRTLLNKGIELFNQHQYNEALAAFDEVLRIEPKHPGAFFGKEQAVLYLNREEKRSYARRYSDVIRDYLSLNENTNYLEEGGVYEIVRAQYTGTFFNSPSPSNVMTDFYTTYSHYYDEPGVEPDKRPYIKVGDFVNPGKILGRIATCGLFENIVSEYSGRIAKILVENTQPVEYDQPLFLIEAVLRTQPGD